MLVQVALIVLAVLAALSLVVDIGYARLTQAQMQTAADAAALEGLRLRNMSADPAANDLERRSAAGRMVQWTFDDDLTPENGDPDYQFGAGPVIDLTGGSEGLHGYQTTSVPDTHVYKPVLQLNQPNEAYGDQVSGRFCYESSPYVSEDAAYGVPGVEVCGSSQTAGGPYARNDFNPGVDDSAFLVRLRRSTEFRGADGQVEPDIASSGPSLPLVFGKGTMIRGDSPDSAYSVRRDGLTVRATAIADTRPAQHVGLPQPQATPPLPGVLPMTLADTFVQAIDSALVPAGCPVIVNVDGSFSAAAGGAARCPVAGTGVGRFVDALTDPARTRWALVSTIGLPRPAPVAVACARVTTLTGYGPVSSGIAASAVNRVIGFAPIQLTRTGVCPAAGAPFTARIVRGPSMVAPANATALLYDGIPLPATATTAELAELLDKHLSRNGRVNYGPLLVPVVAR